MEINLVSDTVTKPTPEMLQAMFTAKVGDDVYKQDPTVNALEEKVAKLFGMEAALFFPSGTMANQTAIKLHTNPGEQIICEGLGFILDGEDAVADRQPVEGQRHEAPRAFAGDDFEMICFAADDDAERDESVIGAALGGEADGGGDFERAGERDGVMRMTRGLDRGARTDEQLVIQMGVEPRFYDQHSCHLIAPRG